MCPIADPRKIISYKMDSNLTFYPFSIFHIIHSNKFHTKSTNDQIYGHFKIYKDILTILDFKKNKMSSWPGLEPKLTAWKAAMLTTRLPMTWCIWLRNVLIKPMLWIIFFLKHTHFGGLLLHVIIFIIIIF